MGGQRRPPRWRPQQFEQAPLSSLEEGVLRMRYGLVAADSTPLHPRPNLQAAAQAQVDALEQTLRQAAGSVPGLPWRRRPTRQRRS